MDNAISRSKDVMSGTAVFRGTRVPVKILFDHLETGHSLDEFLREYPSVRRDQAVEVLEQAKDLLAAG